MLPPKPLSEMTDEELRDLIRGIRAKRVAAEVRASKPRGKTKKRNDDALTNMIAQALEELHKKQKEGEVTP